MRRWVPVLLALGMGLVIVAAAVIASRKVEGLLGSTGADPAAGGASPAPEAPEDTGPAVDLDHPTERDWRFLIRTLEEGTPAARRSAARAMVIAGGMRPVEPLFRQAGGGGEDGDLFCRAALEVLRLQRQEDVLPALLSVMVGPLGAEVSPTCRAEVSDRFGRAGGKDPETLRGLSDHEDPAVRTFVARYLAEVDPVGYEDVLRRLALDPEPAVQTAAEGSRPPPEAPR